MSDTIARIGKLENGYTVCVTDRAAQAANRKPNAVWKDADREYAFPTLKAALKWIADNESTLTPDESDDASNFTAAWNEAKTKEPA